ncbi:MAG: hypothetical protein ACLPYS_18665 [Vulcanimicrobiaceae bacterium]
MARYPSSGETAQVRSALAQADRNDAPAVPAAAVDASSPNP